MRSSQRTPSGPRAQRGGIILKLLFLLFLGFCLLAVYVVRHPLMRLAGNFWISGGDPAHSDAIVLLGEDDYAGDGAARAAQLFKAGWAPRIVASGRYLRPYASTTDLEEHDLMAYGVPKSAIVPLADRAADAEEEISAVGQLISARGWRRILVVTPDYDTRRARYICERELPAGTELGVLAVPESVYHPDSWWQSRRGVWIFFREFVGMFVAIWELRHKSAQTEESLVLGRANRAEPGLPDMRRGPAPFVYS